MGTFAHDQEFYRVKDLAEKAFDQYLDNLGLDEFEEEMRKNYIAGYIHGHYSRNAENDSRGI